MTNSKNIWKGYFHWKCQYSLWKATKRFKKPTQPVPRIKKENGRWAGDDQEKADAFAKYLLLTFPLIPFELTKKQKIYCKILGYSSKNVTTN